MYIFFSSKFRHLSDTQSANDCKYQHSTSQMHYSCSRLNVTMWEMLSDAVMLIQHLLKRWRLISMGCEYSAAHNFQLRCFWPRAWKTFSEHFCLNTASSLRFSVCEKLRGLHQRNQLLRKHKSTSSFDQEMTDGYQTCTSCDQLKSLAEKKVWFLGHFVIGGNFPNLWNIA